MVITSICNFTRISSNDAHVGNNTSKDYTKNMVRAFDLKIHSVAKEAGVHLGQQSALHRV